MKKLNKKMATMMMLVLMLVVTAMPVSAASMKLSKKSAILKTGQSITLQVKGSKKKAKWTTSNKKVATVNQRGKITAKKPGKTTITAKIGKKKLTCKVTVKKAPKKATASNSNSNSTNNTTNEANGNTTNQTIYYKGQKTENGITYSVVADSNNRLWLDISNHTANSISMGWTGDFYITVKTSQGERNIPMDYMESLKNTGRTDLQIIASGNTENLGVGNTVIAGVPQAVTVHNVYPLNANGLPKSEFSWATGYKLVMYTTTILLS